MASTSSRMASPMIRQQLRTPPVFLAPALAGLSLNCSINKPGTQSISRFSTSSKTLHNRDNNRKRGVSALRRKYPKQPLSVAKEPLPKPVLDPSRRTKLTGDPDHGLWGFFPPNRQALLTPEEMASHGRSWTVQELRGKSWEDLHALWWVCAKERNMIATQEAERTRVKAGYGQYEAFERGKTVQKTQRGIKHVLTERWYAYQNALKEMKNDPTIVDKTGVWEDISEDQISSGETALPEASGPAILSGEEARRERAST